MKTRLYILVAVLFLGAACGQLGSDDKPRVEILSSPDQHWIVLGETLQKIVLYKMSPEKAVAWAHAEFEKVMNP